MEEEDSEMSLERRVQDSADRQKEILEAISARKKEHGPEYTRIVYQTAATIACIWQVKRNPNYAAIERYLDYASESSVIRGVMKAEGLLGVDYGELWDEFESDVLALCRHITVQGDDDELDG